MEKLQYLIFDKGLFGIKRPVMYAMDWDVRMPIVRDNYAEHADYGMYTYDSENAYYHARRLFASWVRMGGEDGRGDTNLKKKLLQDFKNYIYVDAGKNEDKEGRTREILFWMNHMKMYREIIDVVKQCNRNFLKDYEESLQNDDGFFWSVTLDQTDLFLQFGDEQLFDYHNLKIAMQFYGLTQLDWKMEELEIRPAGRTISQETYRAYMELADVHTTFQFEERFFSSEKEKACWEVYRTLGIRLKSRADSAEIVLISDTLFGMYASGEYPVEARDEVRIMAIMMHAAAEICLFDALLCLGTEDGKTCKMYEEMALYRIFESSDERLTEIKKFCRQNRNLGKVLFYCLKLVQVKKQALGIREELLVKQLQYDLAYYTSVENVYRMLPEPGNDPEMTGKFAVMNIAYMNDPNEGKLLLNYLGLEQESIRARVGRSARRAVTYPYVFMKCFTSRIDDLPMWEMYGDHAEGCCIVLNPGIPYGIKGRKEMPLYRICYIKKSGNRSTINKTDNPEVDVKMIVKRLGKLRGFVAERGMEEPFYRALPDLLGDIIYLFKDAAYSHEQEVRIFYKYEGVSKEFRHTPGERPFLYIKPDFQIEIKEIIFGPKCMGLEKRMPYFQELVERMCEKNRCDTPEITKSSVEYR